jgi:hypothetical protein
MLRSRDQGNLIAKISHIDAAALFGRPMGIGVGEHGVSSEECVDVSRSNRSSDMEGNI